MIVAALIFLSFFAYGKWQTEYARITSRVEVTQAKVDALADELQATTATIHAAIKSITDRFLAGETSAQNNVDSGQDSSQVLKADILLSELQKLNDAKPTTPTIIMHSGYSCGPCNAWIASRMPQYTKAGWTVKVIKETNTNRPWPWYEITDADGSQFQVDGPLNNEKFQAAKRGK